VSSSLALTHCPCSGTLRSSQYLPYIAYYLRRLAYALQNKRRRVASVLLPVLTTFTFGQWVFWSALFPHSHTELTTVTHRWWPYLLGPRSGTVAMITEHREQLQRLPRLLPARGTNLVPDIVRSRSRFFSPFALLPVAYHVTGAHNLAAYQPGSTVLFCSCIRAPAPAGLVFP
jgi:hypothetical protein